MSKEQAAAVDDRRAAERLERVHYVKVHGRYGLFNGMALNVSRTGALLTLVDPTFTASLATGDLSTVGLRVASMFGEGMRIDFSDTPVTVQGEIVRLNQSEHEGEKVACMGIRFDSELTPAECALLGVSGPHRRAEDGVFNAIDPAELESGPRVSTVRLSEAGGAVDIEKILRTTVAHNATDLHIKAESPVRIRVDGELIDLGDRALTDEDARALVYSLLNDDQLTRFARDGDLDMAHAVKGVGRFRVNVFLSCGLVGMAIRRIPEVVPSIGELGLAPACTSLAGQKRGLVLVTGPTGSGKSTTLAAMVHHVNQTRACHIVTMEDPVEFRHKEVRAHITQREIGRDTKDFAAALKRALRQDPDVIMVGEMRDLETIALAVTAAETGHLVFGTLHTTSAIQTVDRIVDVFPPAQQAQIRMQLAESLRGIVSQVLVPKTGGGVVVAQEVLIATDAVRALVREGKAPQIDNMMQTGAKAGMQTLDAALDQLLGAGQISYDAAVSFARQPSRINRRDEARGGAGGTPRRASGPRPSRR